MHTLQHTFTLTVLAMALQPAYTALAAEEEEDAVDLTPYTTPQSRLAIGVGRSSGDREQFGIFDGVRDSDTVFLFDGEVRKRDNDTGTWTTATFNNFGLDNRALKVGAERQGDWGMNFGYRQMSRYAPYTVNSGITGLGTETQAVPSDTSGYVPGTGSNIVLGTEREQIEVEVFKFLNKEIKFKAGFRNEEKTGNRHWGRGGQAEFAAEPIDWTTRTFDATLGYAGKDLQLQGGYIGNWYTNHNDLVSTTNGANTYNLSLPLDNQAHQFFMDGGYNFTPTTRGTFRVSYTHATQDEHLPTSDVPGLAFAGAPTSLDGEINTTLVFLGLTARPMKNLGVVANLRYHKMDEQTPASLIVCAAPCDGTTTEVHSTPLDYQTLSGTLEGNYRLQHGYSVIAGIDFKNQDRTVPFGNDNDGDGLDNERYVHFRSDLDEMTYRVQLRKSMSGTLNGALSFLHSKRDGSEYSAAEHSFNVPTDPEPPAQIDPINIADRDRNKLRATLDWSPTAHTNLTLNLETAKDDYSGHTYGLREGSTQLISVDGYYALSRNWQLTGWVSHDRSKAEQHNWRDENGAGGSNFSEADLYDTLKDTGNSIGLGLKGRVNHKLNVGANLDWTRTRSEYDQDIVPLGPGSLTYPDTTAPLPDIRSTATKLELYAEYALAQNADLRFDIVHERWTTNDWSWEFSDGTPFIYGTTRDGTMVIADPNQSSTFLGVRYLYKFQ